MGHATVVDAIMRTVHCVHKLTFDIDSVTTTMETLNALYQPTTTDTVQALESRMRSLQIQKTNASLANKLAEYFRCQDEIINERASMYRPNLEKRPLLTRRKKALDALASLEPELSTSINNWETLSLALP